MAGHVIVDTSFLVAFINKRDTKNSWALAQADRLQPPWHTCDAVLSETFYLLGSAALNPVSLLFEGRALLGSFRLDESPREVLDLMRKYSDVPMSFADACLVRMTELLPEPVLLTTDTDFRIYRRLGRKTVPTIMPQDIA